MWKIERIIIHFFALMLAINLTIAGSVAAETIYVDDNGTGDFTTIQAAGNSTSSEKALCSIDFVLPGKLVVNYDTLAGDEQSGVVTGSSEDIPLLADSYGEELQGPDFQENCPKNPFKKEEDPGLKSGDSLELEDGYTLMVSDFSIDGDKAVVKLLKDGEVLEEYILEAGETYYVTSDIFRATSGEKYTLRTGDTWTLNDGYVLALDGVDVYGNKALVSLSKNGVPLDEKIVESGEHYYYNRSAGEEDQIIIDLLLNQAFQGAVDSIAQFIFVAQYSDAGTVDTEPVKIMEVGEEWTLENEYILLLEDVGITSENCLITLKKNNIPVDRRVVIEGENYIYQREEESSKVIKTVLEVPVSTVFYTNSVRCVEFEPNYSTYSDENTVDIDPVVIVDSGSTWDLNDGYELEIKEISRNIEALASILKNDEVLDLDVFGNNYTYQYFRKTSEDGSLQKILDIKVNRIFKGTVNNCVEFSTDYTQNSDLNTVVLDDKIILDKLEQLELDEGYGLTPEAIDWHENKALFLVTKEELYIDEQILPVNSDYYYNRSIEGEDRVILTFTFEKAFLGDLNKLVIIRNLVQNPEGNSIVEDNIRAIHRESAEIRNFPYSGLDLQAILNANGGKLQMDGRNFTDFYYDVENGLVGEELSILHAGSARTIDSEGLVYRTTVRKADYEYGDAGWADVQYDAVGFLGEMFVPLAGSPDKLSMLLLDDDDKYTMRTGEFLDLGNGYTLEAKQVDVDGEKVWLEFAKDGEFVDDEILNTRYPERATWEVDLDGIEGEDDVVVFRVHVNNVMQGEILSIMQVQGLWLIDYAHAFTLGLGNPIDNLEVDTIGSNYLQLTNPLPITLYMDLEEELAGDLKFKVADAQELRFYLCKEYTAPGTYEVAGEIAEGDLPHQWTGLNFAALHYDPDKGIASETLNIGSINSRQVQEGDMRYSTAPVDSEFEYGDWGSYQALWFLADEYLAGYTGMNTGFTGENLSLILEGKLCKVLMNSDDEKLFYTGTSLFLSENYSLNIMEVDMNGGTVWVQLENNGTVVDDAFISLNEDYVYEKSISTIEEIPLIAVHFGNISCEGEIAGVFVEGIFQVSDSCIEVNAGDVFGKMKVISVSSSRISMKNEEAFYLVMDSDISITDNIWFRVADTETLRFYPIVNVEILQSMETYLVVDDDQSADYSSIQDAVDNAAPGATILVKPGTYVENVDVDKTNITIRSESGNPFDTIVQAASSPDHVFHVTADRVKISGFSITGASGSSSGICLEGVEYCFIENNELSNNFFGVWLESSSNSNTLFLNDLLNNSVQIREEGSNFWNSLEPVNYLYNGERKTNYLGNYYSDYSGPDEDGNGIVDTPYEYDSYPLLAPSDNYVPLAFDNGFPVINSVELSPIYLYAGESILVTVNSTDNISVYSVEASGISLTWTGEDIWKGSLVAEEGTHPVNVSAADAWGNVAWDNSSSYTAVAKPEYHSSSGSSGGGGGGGGGGGSPEPASNVEIKELSQQFVTSGNPARFDFPEGVTCVCYVAFDAKRTFGKTFTTIEMLKGKSTLVGELPAGIVYKNVNIWVGNEGVASPENIGNSVVGFRVEKEWLESNGIDENTVLLYRYSDGEWSALVTRVTGDDENFVYFEAETPGYSPFTIAASRVEITEKEDSVDSKTTISALEAKAEDSTHEDGVEKAPGFGAGLALPGILCALCILKKSRKHD
ncbi:hypothetical protein MSSAC_1279 [Methanosarcina siciliae C2J]|uniref:Cell surface protein n=2 Tax=Methanosarcina siciliae TaxID=38027 RepID=A0A0E3PLW0_9EURY|nr:hypothetical protein MSSAC_1279 [Methanosarcina siciliae C2J]